MRRAGKYVFFSSSVVLALLHLSVWINDNHAFSLRKVFVTGTEILSAEAILKLVESDSIENVWKADVRALESRIEELPQIQRVSISRTFPSSLRISVVERAPVAIVLDNGIWGVDASGFLLPRFRPEVGLDFPVIVGLRLAEYVPGKVIDNPRIITIAAFLAELRRANPVVYNAISEITYKEPVGIKLHMVDASLPVFLGKEKLVQKCAELRATWQYLLREKKLQEIQYLDVRYDGQVILKHRTRQNS